METDAVDDQDVLYVLCLARSIPRCLLCPPSSPLIHDGFLRRFRRRTVFTCVISRQYLNQRGFETRQFCVESTLLKGSKGVRVLMEGRRTKPLQVLPIAHID